MQRRDMPIIALSHTRPRSDTVTLQVCRSAISAFRISQCAMRVHLLLLSVLLVGCAIEREARLYPANDEAAPSGVLRAKFIEHGTGNGDVEIRLPDGEVLRGEYSVVYDTITGFGSILASVYGAGGSAAGAASSSGYSVRGRSQGTASVFGDRATRMHCEFLNDSLTGHGYGACKSSKGVLYRLQY